MLNKIGMGLLDAIQVIGISALTILILHVYVFQPNEVSGKSMYPYLEDKDRIITEKVTYRLNEPKRGDVIVFKYPLNKNEDFIKRIIALPNEEIELKNSLITIYNPSNPQGLILKENYLPKGTITNGRAFLTEGKRVKVPEDHYFVMGDNREGSSDSRQWGFISRKDIVGRAAIRIWPANTFSLLGSVE